MRVYVSVDMEGVAGVATADQVTRGGHGYPRAQRLMTAEANAAIAGAFDAGAEDVLVNDSHGTMDNLLPDELDQRARLLLGEPKSEDMAAGIAAEHDVALFLGYHAAAGAPGVLAHTYSTDFFGVRLNSRPVSEAELGALQAAAVGVPVGLVTGDNVLCDLVRTRIPRAFTAEVKTAYGYSAADSLSPAQACDRIRSQSAQAVAKATDLPAAEIPGVLDLEIDLHTTNAAALAARIPGTRRVADRTVLRSCADPTELVDFIIVCDQLAGSPSARD
ncbi:M55 family metallopeptidase [Amycolatopsis anabasis]|uniref:M55 family metallopeptidase n=1 Tax=Amycolatopsis anabasis TaxID=1840409 RepID=UPI00131DE50A|nr:M55 family metallopeptidase [Amycolatopsis anabasis]